MSNDQHIEFQTVPTRAVLTLRGLVVFEAPISQEDVDAVFDVLGREMKEIEEGFGMSAQYREDDDGARHLLVGDQPDVSGTSLSIFHEPVPEFPGLSVIMHFNQESLARIWQECRESISATHADHALSNLVQAVLSFAADEGGQPAVAFNAWMEATGRQGRAYLPPSLWLPKLPSVV